MSPNPSIDIVDRWLDELEIGPIANEYEAICKSWLIAKIKHRSIGDSPMSS
jgi:hypothetical protein